LFIPPKGEITMGLRKSRVSGKPFVAGIFVALLLLVFAGFPLHASGADDAKKEKVRADINKTAEDTLSRLYKAQPAARAAIRKAAGYAFFSNFGMKIFIAGAAPAKGLP
jgi:hypothetical protein